MTTWLRRQLPSLAVLLLLAGAGFWLLLRPAPPLPGLSLPLANGGRVRLGAYRGQALVIRLWSDGCAPCRQDPPVLTALYPELRRRDARLLIIDLGTSVPPKAALPGALALDPQHTFSRATGNAFQAPATLLVDREGRIREQLRGALDPSRILAWLATQ
jgi:peroxiredoxin